MHIVHALRRAQLAGILALSLGLLALPSFFGASCASADVVLLSDGSRLTGTIANRSLYSDQQLPGGEVAIYVEDGSGVEAKVRRIPLAEVALLVFEDGTERRVIDPSVFDPVGLEPDVPLRFQSPADDALRARRITGGVLLALGAVAVVAAVLLPQGDEVYETTSGGRLVDTGRDYSAVNYVVMGAGAAASLGGFFMLTRGGQEVAEDPDAELGGRQGFSPGVSVSWQF